MKYFLLIILLAFTTPVLGHDPARPDLDQWFMGLHNKQGGLCCSGHDGTVLSDIDWDTKDGHYRVRLGGRWIDVPPDAVVTEPNRDGPAMVWPYYINGEFIGIRCFMPGVQT